MHGTTKRNRAAIYARYSTDEQNEQSIGDQVAVCEDSANRYGLKVVRKYEDAAKSGATMFERDGLRQLVDAAKAKKFDWIVVESLDRLSRDPADLHWMFDRFVYHDVQIRTLNDGVISKLNVHIRGMTGSMETKSTGDRVRRHVSGRVREGKFPSSLTYGYRLIPGKPGEREIDPERAAIVRRIFTEYAAGRSPRDIVLDLTREGIPTGAPTSKWNRQRLVGGGSLTGFLSNRLYIGEIVFNKARNQRNPDSGCITHRRTTEEDFVRGKAPHLRIIEQPLWNAVQARREERSKDSARKQGAVPRHNYLLGGMIRCGTCGGSMTIRTTVKNTHWIACNAGHHHGTCEHRRVYDLGKLTRGLLANLKTKLLSPEALARAKRIGEERLAKRAKSDRSDHAVVQKQLTKVQVQIDRIVAVVIDGDLPVQELKVKLKALEADRAGLTQRLRQCEAETNVVEFHPNLVKAYKANVERLTMLGPDEASLTPEQRAAVRNMLDTVVVYPTPRRLDYEFQAFARIGALLGVSVFPNGVRTPDQIIEEEGISSSWINARSGSRPSIYPTGKIIALGRWKAAA